MLKLTDKLRVELKKPYGNLVFSVKEVKNPVACVGDVVGYTFLSSGILPKILIFDGKSERKPFDKVEELKNLSSNYVHLKARNPPSTITLEVVKTIGEAVRLADRGNFVRIFVEGEEDLTLIPLICALRENSGSVVYGQPRAGIVDVEVTREKKLLILQLLEQMVSIKHNGNNGDDVIDTCRRWVNGSCR
ncbi:MAG: hypothetical protein DSY33_02940 [Archaeoglobus sp.]|jgi:uncharacterized protein (UPF0218 family)|nr:MAG: hypothetical protein DSY33_02940 [Archaeoglobus sp.]